jgi:hypothetical protein
VGVICFRYVHVSDGHIPALVLRNVFNVVRVERLTAARYGQMVRIGPLDAQAVTGSGKDTVISVVGSSQLGWKEYMVPNKHEIHIAASA